MSPGPSDLGPSEPTKGVGKVGPFEGTEGFHAEVGHSEVSIREHFHLCHRSHLVSSPEGDL